MKRLLMTFGALMLGLFVLGCSSDDEGSSQQELFEEQLKKDIIIIDDYLASEGIKAIEHTSGIRYVLNQGSGAKPTVQNAVRVNYSGRLLGASNNFDSGEDVTFPLGSLISGWQIILPLVQEGGSVTLYLPSGYGYGSTGSGSTIPSNANLIFDIDLIEVK